MMKLRMLLLPVTAISMVFVMLIPVPSFVLDLLLAASITASVIVFLTAVQITEGGGLLRVSDAAAFADAVSAITESGVEPENSAAWT